MQIEKCDSENTVLAFRAFLAHSKFYVENLAVSGNDNAFVMVGIKNCVYKNIEKDVPS